MIDSLPAAAAPADARVFTDDITPAGTRNVEFQASLARPAPAAPSGSVQAFRGLAELAYGIANHWELSAQLPVARVDGNWHANGISAELQYIAPHDDDKGFYWGGRSELGYVSKPGETRSWQVELRPIVGYRSSDWHFALNPTITWGLTGEDRNVQFEPSAKVSYQLTKRTAVGAEYFVEAGPLANPLPRSQRSELAFLVFDMNLGKSEVSLGLGRGMTDASERWVVKLITSLAFD